MRKYKLNFSLIVGVALACALALAACGNLTPPTSAQPPKASSVVAAATAAEPTAEPTQPPAANPTEPQSATTAPIVAGTAAAPTVPVCRVDTSTQSDTSQADQFPKVGNTEWTQGPQGAYIKILEYSDFQ
jgi:hypothetical protein